MSTVFMGKLEAKRRKGRPPTNYIDNVVKASGLSGMQELMHLSREREQWRNLVTSHGAPNIDSGDGDR